jgi:hypothetical protein
LAQGTRGAPARWRDDGSRRAARRIAMIVKPFVPT